MERQVIQCISFLQEVDEGKLGKLSSLAFNDAGRCDLKCTSYTNVHLKLCKVLNLLKLSCCFHHCLGLCEAVSDQLCL